MRKETFFQSLSIFTARIWLHYNALRGDTRHSYRNDFETDLRRVNHRLGYRSLMNMITDYRKEFAFKNVIVYDNINGVCVYDETFVPSQNTYRIRLNCDCKFYQTDTGAFLYAGYESYDPDTGEVILNSADQEKVKQRANDAYKYLKKRLSMPQVLHPKAVQDRIEQGRGQADGVQSIQERLRDEKIFAGLSPEQLSKMADMLMQQKGRAA